MIMKSLAKQFSQMVSDVSIHRVLVSAETRSFAKELGLKPVTTLETSPQSNGIAESLVKAIKWDYGKLVNNELAC